MKNLVEKRNALIEEMEAMLNTADTEVRAINEEELARIEAIKADIGAIDNTIKTKEEARSLERLEKVEDKNMRNTEIRQLLVAGAEVEVRNGEVTNANVGTEKTEFLAGVVEKVADISPLFAKANKINTSSTSAVTVQGTKLPKFVKMSELAEYTKAQATFEEKILRADKYGLAVVVSDECLEDAHFDLEGQITSQLVEGLGLTLNELLTKKLESVEGANKIEISLNEDGLMDMYYSLPVAYRNGAVFIINPEMERQIAKLKDANGQPLMIRSFTDRPVYTILGCEVIVDANVTKPMFVNLGKALIVGVRRAMNIKRDDSIGFLSGTIAFRADVRLDAVATIEEAIVIGDIATVLRAKK